MKKYILIIAIIGIAVSAYAQMDVPAPGGNPRATITETIGITDITLSYSRPDVSGREGKIWGTLVPYGFSTFSFITNGLTAPWRAGANENTTISFEHPVTLEGHEVPAGTYGIHMAMYPDSVILILSTKSDAWGSFYYEQKYDQLRVALKPQINDKNVEWLKYEFVEHRPTGATVAMMWEKMIVPFKIEVDVDNIVVSVLRDQVTSQKGFNASNLLQAAQYCINKNINLEEALSWSQKAVNGFGSIRSYTTLSNLANAYTKLNKTAQADSVMSEALPMANVNQYVAYGRSLISQKRSEKAMEVMTMALDRFGDIQAVNTGLAYTYSSKANFAKALEYAYKSLSQAPNENAKKAAQALIDKLKDKKDIN